MKKLFMVGIVVALLIGMTVPVFAGNPGKPPTTPMAVKGTATTIALDGTGYRITTINASITSGDIAKGTVKIDSHEPYAVINLRFDGDWAYLIVYGTNWLFNVQEYRYLVVYNGSRGSMDKVSALLRFDENADYAGVRTWFDAGWKTNVLYDGGDLWYPLLQVIKGGFNFTP